MTLPGPKALAVSPRVMACAALAALIILAAELTVFALRTDGLVLVVGLIDAVIDLSDELCSAWWFPAGTARGLLER